MEASWIAVWDQTGRIRPGTAYRGAMLHASRAAKGVFALPADPRLLERQDAASGYFQRDYGDGGTALEPSKPSACCPMLLRAEPGGTVHWAVGLRAVDPAQEIAGQLSLMGDSRHAGTIGRGLLHPNEGPVRLQQRLAEPPHVLVVHGFSRLASPAPGLLCVALWGWASNAVALWSACTQVLA